MSKYDDMIDLPHPTSRKHPRMSMYERAAQFVPFAALTGYEEAIEETARRADSYIVLDEEGIRDLNDKLNYIVTNINDNIKVSVEYFVKDTKKDGGLYKTYIGNIRLIDEVEKKIIFKDKTIIYLRDIYHIEIIK